MERTKRHGPEGGFSLLEVMLATAILFLIIAVAFSFINDGTKLLSSTAIVSEAEVHAGHVAEQIVRRLRNGVILTLEDGAGGAFADGATTTNGVRVRLFDSYAGEAWVNDGIAITLGTDGESNVTDGVDNDNDNIIDEKSILLGDWTLAREKAASSTGFTGTDVVEYNLGGRVGTLSCARDGRRLTVTVTIMKYDPQLRAVRTITGTSQVTFRN